MRITTTVDADAGTLAVKVEGRVGLLPVDVIAGFVAGWFSLGLAEAGFEAAELRATAERLLATGLTERLVAETIGVTVDQVRRWDDDAAADGEVDQLVEGLVGS